VLGSLSIAARTRDLPIFSSSPRLFLISPLSLWPLCPCPLFRRPSSAAAGSFPVVGLAGSQLRWVPVVVHRHSPLCRCRLIDTAPIPCKQVLAAAAGGVVPLFPLFAVPCCIRVPSSVVSLRCGSPPSCHCPHPHCPTPSSPHKQGLVAVGEWVGHK
jgi:hypothetical protein